MIGIGAIGRGKRNHTVGAAQSAIRILRYLGGSAEPQRLTRIAADLDLHASTCLNILRTLIDEGMLVHHHAAKTYALGYGAIDLARRALMRGESLELVQPLLDDYSRRHGVSVLLWRRVNDSELMAAAHSTVGALVHIRADIGTRLPLLTGSMGRVIAAAQDLEEATLRSLFKDVDWHRTIDFDTFMTQAAAANARGWAADRGSMDSAWHGISAPVLESGPLLRIISVPLFVNQFQPDQVERLGDDLMRLGMAIASRQSPRSDCLAQSDSLR